ncbi:MAG TPA: class I SAM-dependent methyltransferase [Candidatus Saccharimonadales bacterium]|nr:class I SAM-dependent methyltransferase [Candidatus Saccharimonadales bacterium]
MPAYNFEKLPDHRAVLAEWELRAKRPGLASVMRESHTVEETEAAAVSMESAVMSFITRNLGSLAGKRILEIGTGIGRFSRPLAESAESVTTVDMTEAMIVRAQENLRDLDNITFLKSEIKDLDFEPNQFDLVFDVWVLMHVMDNADFEQSIAVMTSCAPAVFICEYTDQGDKPVGPYSILRSVQEYCHSIQIPVSAEDEFYYGGDRSALILFEAL